MDAAKFAEVLQGTLSPVNDVRSAAEKQLRALTEIPGYLNALISIMTMPGASVAVKTASALALKRAARDWSEDNTAQQEENKRKFGRPDLFADAEKQIVRQSLVPLATSQSDIPVLNALSDAMRLIAREDFPECWPELVPAILGALSSGHPPTILNALRLSHALMKNYEMESWDHAAQGPVSPGDAAARDVLPVLETIAKTLLGGSITPDTGKALSITLKSYFRIIHFRLWTKAGARQITSIDSWVHICLSVLALQLPAGDRASSDADSPWWHAKKWAVTILCRLMSNYADPTNISTGKKGKGSAQKTLQAELKATAKHIRDVVIPSRVLPAVLQCLKTFVDRTSWLSSRVQHGLLACLNQAYEEKAWKAVLTPYWAWIAGEVIPLILTLSEEDMEAVEADPMSWLDSDEDMMSAWQDPRQACDMWLLGAFESNPIKKVVQPVLEGYIGKILGASAAASTPAARKAAIPGKEVVLRILGLLSNSWRSSKAHRSQLQALLTTHVSSELAPGNPPILRIRAVRTWTSFITSEAIEASVKSGVIVQMLNMLGDSNEAVRLVAANCLQQAIAMADVAADTIRPHLTQLLTGLFSMLDELGHSTVVELLNTLVKRFLDESPELAGPLATKLASVLASMLAKWNASNETDDDDADDVETAAGTVLETLLTMLELLTLGDLVGEGEDDDEEEDAQGAAAAAKPAGKRTLTPQQLADHEKRLHIAVTSVLPHVWSVLDALLPPMGDLAVALGRDPHGAVWIDLLDLSAAIMAQSVVALDKNVSQCEPAWALLPRICDILCGPAFEWLGDMVAPLDALLDYGRDRVGAAGIPAAHGLTGPQAAMARIADPVSSFIAVFDHAESSADATADDRCLAARLATSALWHVWRTPGGLRLLQHLVPLYVKGFGKSKTEGEQCACASVICMALQVSPSATLACIRGVPGVDVLAFLQQFLKVCADMKRLVEVKTCVLGLCELLQECARAPALAQSLSPAMPGILAVAVEAAATEDRLRLDASALKAHNRKRDAEELEDDVGSEEGAQKGDAEGEEDEEVDDGEEGEEGWADGDELDEEDEEAMHRMGGYDDEDSTNDKTPQDHIDSKLSLAATVQALSSLPDAASMQARLPAITLPKLGSLMAQAQTLAAEGKVLAALQPLPIGE